MTIVLKSKTTFNQVQISNVTNIAYNGTNYTITAGGSSTSYSAANYYIYII